MKNVNRENPMPQELETTSISPPRHGRRRRSRRHKRRFEIFDRLRRLVKNKRTKKKLIMTAIYVAIALFCFLAGYYYFGPKIINMDE